MKTSRYHASKVYSSKQFIYIHISDILKYVNIRLSRQLDNLAHNQNTFIAIAQMREHQLPSVLLQESNLFSYRQTTTI